MSRNKDLYELGVKEIARLRLGYQVITDGSYTLCLIDGHASLFGIAKRNPIDAPNKDRGAAIAVRRAIIKLGRQVAARDAQYKY